MVNNMTMGDQVLLCKEAVVLMKDNLNLTMNEAMALALENREKEKTNG
jgi:hypothetical protein